MSLERSRFVRPEYVNVFLGRPNGFVAVHPRIRPLLVAVLRVDE